MFQRIPPEPRDKPPSRITTKDVGKTIGAPEEEINDLEKLAELIPEGCKIEEAKVIAPRILSNSQ